MTVAILLSPLFKSLSLYVVILEHDSDKEPPNHTEVVIMDILNYIANQRAKDMCKLVKCVIEKLTNSSVIIALAVRG